MKYLKRFLTEDQWQEVSQDDAMRVVLGTYRDTDEVRSWVTTGKTPEGNTIRCMMSEIKIIGDGETERSS